MDEAVLQVPCTERPPPEGNFPSHGRILFPNSQGRLYRLYFKKKLFQWGYQCPLVLNHPF
jgi:hypothetical protein